MKPSSWLVLLGIGLSASACVSEDAGYQDVRNTTAARIHRDVRWDAHDSASVTQKETHDLLARPLDAKSAVQVSTLESRALESSLDLEFLRDRARAQIFQNYGAGYRTCEQASRRSGRTTTGASAQRQRSSCRSSIKDRAKPAWRSPRCVARASSIRTRPFEFAPRPAAPRGRERSAARARPRHGGCPLKPCFNSRATYR